MDARKRAARIRLVALDVDGAMTGGGKGAVRAEVQFILAARGRLDALVAGCLALQ